MLDGRIDVGLDGGLGGFGGVLGRWLVVVGGKRLLMLPVGQVLSKPYPLLVLGRGRRLRTRGKGNSAVAAAVA